MGKINQFAMQVAANNATVVSTPWFSSNQNHVTAEVYINNIYWILF